MFKFIGRHIKLTKHMLGEPEVEVITVKYRPFANRIINTKGTGYIFYELDTSDNSWIELCFIPEKEPILITDSIKEEYRLRYKKNLKAIPAKAKWRFSWKK